MKLSQLQKHILLSAYISRGKAKRTEFLKFYNKRKNRPSKKDSRGIITKSIERLIDRGLLVGFGRRTPRKWFIEEVKLTSQGRMQVKDLFGQQQSLPFKAKKIKK